MGYRSRVFWKLRSVSPGAAALLAQLVGRTEFNASTYQVVRVDKTLQRLHGGRFSDAHELFASKDSHLNFDTNVTRLRNYFTCSFLEMALNLRSKWAGDKGERAGGGVMVAGASYGTAAKTFSRVCDLAQKDIELWVIDPLDGRGGTNYNVELKQLLCGFPDELKVNVKTESIPEALATISYRFFFFHLNTGNFEAEVASLPWIFRHAEETAFLVLDLYGWLPDVQQRKIDHMLAQAGWSSLVLPTFQLIAYPASSESVT